MVTRHTKIQTLVLTLILSLTATMGCTTNQLPPGMPNLIFESFMQETLEGEFLISLEVCNTGLGIFEGDENFNGVMEVRDEDWDVRTRAEIIRIQALEQGESVFPISWRGDLLPGIYTLIWGAPDYGFTEIDFEVTDYDGLHIICQEYIDNPGKN